MHGESPWRRLRHLPHVTVVWADLPDGLMGFVDFPTSTITLATGLSQAERRSVCAHELGHLHRGSVPEHLTEREERAIDLAVARDLVPFQALVDAMLWSGDEYEIAAELTVSPDLVRVRLHALSAAETDALNQALDDAEPRFP